MPLDEMETRRRYDEAPEFYDRRYSEIQKAKYPILLDMLEPTHGQAILDWGCGTGLARAALDQTGAIAIGSDSSIGMLKRASGRKKGNLVLADCIRLPFRKASFDGLLGATVIQNIIRTDKAIAEISRVLRSGGRAVLSYPRNVQVELQSPEIHGLRPQDRRLVGEDVALSFTRIPR